MTETVTNSPQRDRAEYMRQYRRRRPSLIRRNKTIAKAFYRALSLLSNNCDYFGDDINVPHMSGDEAETAIEALKQARSSLGRLIKRIKEQKNANS